MEKFLNIVDWIQSMYSAGAADIEWIEYLLCKKQVTQPLDVVLFLVSEYDALL